MDYAFCLLTLKSSEKWRSPLFGATCNFNDQILPYGVLFLAFINTDVFYLLSFKFSPNLLRPWRFPLTSKGGVCVFSAKQILLNKYNDWKDAKNK